MELQFSRQPSFSSLTRPNYALRNWNLSCCFVIQSVVVFVLFFQQGDLNFEAIAHCDIQCYLGKSDSGMLILGFFFLGI